MNKGASLYLTIVIMSVLLAIVLGLSTILVGQIKILRGMENSVIAFYAADSGIEMVLLDRANPIGLDGCSGTLDNGAEYNITVEASGSGDCPSGINYCIKSTGSYKETSRAIEIRY